eukprot:COSAG02_NODE_37851_length_436_cov_2.299703_1_plen_58_part_00
MGAARLARSVALRALGLVSRAGAEMGIEKDLDEMFSYETVRLVAPPACAAAPAGALL